MVNKSSVYTHTLYIYILYPHTVHSLSEQSWFEGQRGRVEVTSVQVFPSNYLLLLLLLQSTQTRPRTHIRAPTLAGRIPFSSIPSTQLKHLPAAAPGVPAYRRREINVISCLCCISFSCLHRRQALLFLSIYLFLKWDGSQWEPTRNRL